ncbi:hypothetical protein [Salinigranum halophilum]|jgi:ABC-type multidrug transport system fused ATPase/permease subunit|uniref:hypothetical protein n=1 Tax=Salinigranum halophilum TaxID=2565931 RepID=UPI0010A8C103|nr:hypothetical protein [Salinigranum halophilum]
MVDLEDFVEAIVDIEDIVEEVTEPAELLEDFVEAPLLIVFALGAAVAAVLTLVLMLVTLLFVLFAVGPVAVVASLVLVGGLLTMLTVAGFVYLRPEIPASVRRKIDAARERSDSTRRDGASMSEQEAIDELKRQYVEGTLTEPELERALDDVLTSNDPARVVELSR